MTKSLESDFFIADKTIRHDKIIHNKDQREIGLRLMLVQSR